MEDFPNIDIGEEVMFEEILLLKEPDGETVTEVVVAVEPVGENLAVYMYSSDRQLRVRACVTRTLVTAAEVRQRGEVMLRLTDDGDEYMLFSATPVKDKKKISKSSVPLILEGANIIFLRHVAVKGLCGQWTARTVTNEAQLSECEYRVVVESDAVTVTRMVDEEKMTTKLTHDGRILLHQWAKSGRQLVSSQPQREVEDEGSRPQSLTSTHPLLEADQPAYWQRKEELLLDMRQYLQDQVGVQDMIADFIKELLFDKPDDPINFADLYFSEMMGIERPDDNDSEI